MLKFYYAPGACSLGIHVILEETGADYQRTAIDLSKGEHLTEEFRRINPKRRVPALVRDDGSLLTEFQAIAFWLADQYPASELLPPDQEGRIRVMEALDFIVGAVHMRGFSFLLAPGIFVDDPASREALARHGRRVVVDGLNTLSLSLGEGSYLLGSYSIADAGLFYLTRWACRLGVEMPGNLREFDGRMRDRPAVQRALAAEAPLAQ